MVRSTLHIATYLGSINFNMYQEYLAIQFIIMQLATCLMQSIHMDIDIHT